MKPVAAVLESVSCELWEVSDHLRPVHCCLAAADDKQDNDV